MFSNYSRVAYRNMLRNPMASLINITGLAIGLATCLIVYLFIVYETGYDRQFSDFERIYRIQNNYRVKDQNSEGSTAKLPPATGALLKQQMPELENIVRFYATPDKESQFSKGNDRYFERHVYFADSDVFEVFDLEFIEGSPGDTLTKPFSVVLTESMAKKYFSDVSPIGQTITYKNKHDFQVTGVIRDMPEQTHLGINMLVSINSLPQTAGPKALESWVGSRCYTYVKTAPGADQRKIISRVSHIIENLGSTDKNYESSYYLMPLSDLHLHSQNYNEMKPNGDINNIYVFLVICLIMLIVVGINFINLSTARAMQRAKEVGVRKSIGAAQSQIIVQFLSESVLLTAISAILGTAIAVLLMPVVSEIFGRELSLGTLLSWKVFVFLITVTLAISLLAGMYPAVFLSKFEPAKVLKGDITQGSSGNLFRKSLVSFQFVITVFLIVCTAFMYLQMTYISKKRVGYNTDNKIMVRIPYSEAKSYKPLKSELLKHPDILEVVGSSATPTESVGDKRYFIKPSSRDEKYVLAFVGIEEDFFDFYGLELVHGRKFSKDFSTDKFTPPKKDEAIAAISFVVNEMAARDLGWSPEESIGKQLEMPITKTQTAIGNIIGIIKDTNFDSFKNDPVPMVFYVDEAENSRISIKLSGKNLSEVIAHIENSWNIVLPLEPVQIRFVDTMFSNLYKNENQQVNLFNILSVVSIFLSLLGLYGLNAYNAEKRAKEIAIRKVLGASTARILGLLSRETLMLLLLSNLVAWPLSFLVVQSWLSSFVYRIDITLWVFIAAALSAFILAWLTLASQALQVANRSMVTSLKTE